MNTEQAIAILTQIINNNASGPKQMFLNAEAALRHLSDKLLKDQKHVAPLKEVKNGK